MKQFYVWVKGCRGTTEQIIEADLRINALLVFAGRRGLKTIACDALMVRKAK